MVSDYFHYVFYTPLSLHFDGNSVLAITFDADLQMTRDLDHSKALVQAHLFKGVSSQSEHFPKNRFSAKNDKTGHPKKEGLPPPHYIILVTPLKM